MNKNLIAILLIFTIPLCAYWFMDRYKSADAIPITETTNPQIIKFSSPMCYECQELEKIFEEIYPQYSKKIELKKINVTSNDKVTKQLINEYQVTLVPTTVFKDKRNNTIRRIEGSIQPKILDNYIKELLDE